MNLSYRVNKKNPTHTVKHAYIRHTFIFFQNLKRSKHEITVVQCIM